MKETIERLSCIFEHIEVTETDEETGREDNYEADDSILNTSGKGEHTEVTESRDDGSGDNDDDGKGEDDTEGKDDTSDGDDGDDSASTSDDGDDGNDADGDDAASSDSDSDE